MLELEQAAKKAITKTAAAPAVDRATNFLLIASVSALHQIATAQLRAPGRHHSCVREHAGMSLEEPLHFDPEGSCRVGEAEVFVERARWRQYVGIALEPERKSLTAPV